MDSERELRAEFRHAIDAVTPPAPWLRASVKERLHEKRRQGWWEPAGRAGRPLLLGVRAAAALAAVLLVVLLIVTVFVGGTVWRDWQRFNSRPAPAGNWNILADLRARPLNLPVVPPGGACPSTPTSAIDYNGQGASNVFGGGPVYGVGGPVTTTKWGDYFDVTYVADPQLTGIVLVRIRDLESDQVGIFVGPYAAGSVVGTDTISGKAVQQQPELILDTSHHPATSGTSKWGIWHVRQGLAAGWSHCFGIQVDGAGFSEIFTGNG